MGTTSSVTEPSTPSISMRAVTQDRYGLPDVLTVREVDRPAQNREQVLIHVHAASLNFYDWHMTTGTPYMIRATSGLRQPDRSIPGADVAGVIEAVGDDVRGLGVGDAVFGDIGHGAFAEYACTRVRNLARKPDNVSFQQAAATPMAGLTALQGLRDHGELRQGQRVLVNGASGGVGTFAVQIAKALGAEVTAVCSTTKVDMARSIGADRVIDYTTDDYTVSERGYDILLDNVGDRPWSETSRVLAPEGINVTITGPKHAVLGPMRNLLAGKIASRSDSRSLVWFTAQVKQEDLQSLARMLADGSVVPVIEKTYPLEMAPDALRYLGQGHALGKLVIAI